MTAGQLPRFRPRPSFAALQEGSEEKVDGHFASHTDPVTVEIGEGKSRGKSPCIVDLRQLSCTLLQHSPGNEAPSIHWIGELVCPRAVWDLVPKTIAACAWSQTLIVQPKATRDWLHFSWRSMNFVMTEKCVECDVESARKHLSEVYVAMFYLLSEVRVAMFYLESAPSETYLRRACDWLSPHSLLQILIDRVSRAEW